MRILLHSLQLLAIPGIFLSFMFDGTQAGALEKENPLRPATIPESSKYVAGLKIDQGTPWSDSSRLYVALAKIPDDAILKIPRLANSVRSVFWQGAPESAATLKPEPTSWLIQLPPLPDQAAKVLVLDLDGPLTLMSESLRDGPDSDGIIRLPASHAITHGINLRYEPQPHKNTVGYWSNEKDHAEWHFQSAKTGKYEVDILQGCGKGHGGSDVTIHVDDQTLSLTVLETGHFQNFIWRTVGVVDVTEGMSGTLKLIPAKKVAGAVMDVREVRLVPVGKSRSFQPQLADSKALPPGLPVDEKR